MRRFSIAGCMAAVCFFAIGSAALTHPTEHWASGLFTLAIFILTWASVKAVFRRRAFWTGFAAFGWVYLIASFGMFGSKGTTTPPFPPPPSLLSTYLMDSLEARVIRQTVRNNPVRMSVKPKITPSGGTIVSYAYGNPTTFQTISLGPPMFAHAEFHQIGHSLLTLLVAMAGGILMGITLRNDRRSEEPAGQGTREG